MLAMSWWCRGRNAQRLTPALSRGAHAARSATELATHCEAVFLCVTDTQAVEAVVFGPTGVAEGGVAGTLIIDHSTISPARSRDLAARLRSERQMGWLDAPVSGGAPGARAGTLSILVGGEVADIERARPWLEAYGKNITHLGAAGAGQAAKSCSGRRSSAPRSRRGSRSWPTRAIGLDVNQLVAALEGSWSDSPVRKHIVPHLARARETAGNDLLQKDLRIVAETAEAHGVALPLAALAAASQRTTKN